jgi:hypothetical protein
MYFEMGPPFRRVDWSLTTFPIQGVLATKLLNQDKREDLDRPGLT